MYRLQYITSLRSFALASIARASLLHSSVRVSRFLHHDYESCTLPISTHPTSAEGGELGQTRGISFVACRLELAVITLLLWFQRGRILFFSPFSFECTRLAARIGLASFSSRYTKRSRHGEIPRCQLRVVLKGK